MYSKHQATSTWPHGCQDTAKRIKIGVKHTQKIFQSIKYVSISQVCMHVDTTENMKYNLINTCLNI